jgi:hypothetical protein
VFIRPLGQVLGLDFVGVLQVLVLVLLPDFFFPLLLVEGDLQQFRTVHSLLPDLLISLILLPREGIPGEALLAIYMLHTAELWYMADPGDGCKIVNRLEEGGVSPNLVAGFRGNTSGL